MIVKRSIGPIACVAGLIVLLAGCGGAGQAGDSPIIISSSGGSGSSGSTSGGGAGSSGGPPPPEPALVLTGPSVAAPDGKQEIYYGQADGSGLTQLTADGRPKFLVHFSPDGRTLLYTKFTRGGYRSADMQSEVAVFERATGVETMLTSGGNWLGPVRSPDGRTIAYTTFDTDALWLMNSDGSDKRVVARVSGRPDDRHMSDFLWSRDNWIYFTVEQHIDGCFKVRIDRIRPDGSERTQITDGGPHCTPAGFEQSGDSDPGISPDGLTLYSSRGLPRSVPGHPELTVRHLIRTDTSPWFPGKPESDLSLGAMEDCIAGVPKVSWDSVRVALFQFCPDRPEQIGVWMTDPLGSRYRYLFPGFAPDWNPLVR